MTWDCFYWSGLYATLCDHQARADDASPTPPPEPEAWCRKPCHLRHARYRHLGQATAWLWDHMHTISTAVAVWTPHPINLDAHMHTARQRLRRDQAFSWSMPLPGGLATVVGVARNPAVGR